MESGVMLECATTTGIELDGGGGGEAQFRTLVENEQNCCSIMQLSLRHQFSSSMTHQQRPYQTVLESFSTRRDSWSFAPDAGQAYNIGIQFILYSIIDIIYII